MQDPSRYIMYLTVSTCNLKTCYIYIYTWSRDDIEKLQSSIYDQGTHGHQFSAPMAEVTLPAIQSSLVPENGDQGFASRGGTAPGNPFDSRWCNSQNLYMMYTLYLLVQVLGIKWISVSRKDI